MSTIDQLAETVRAGRASETLPEIKRLPQSLSERDRSGVPLCHLFCLTEQLHCVKDCLDGGIAKALGRQRRTLVHAAAQVGCLALLQEILAKNEYLLYQGDTHGDTPVHVAARFGHLDQFQDLRSKPASLAARNNLLQTPMHMAALFGHLHQVKDALNPKLLVMRDVYGETCLGYAKRRGFIDQLPPRLLRQATIELDPSQRTPADVLEQLGLDPRRFLRAG